MKFKYVLFIVLLFCLYFLFFSFSYSANVSDNLESSLFRLHIVANSDSEEDQNLKLIVRDRVVEYLHSFSFSSKDDLIEFVSNNTHELESIVNNTITDYGFSYSCNIYIGNSFFPKKVYDNVVLPSGFYDGLKIELGNADGHNWWCVLFPPMCLIDGSTCEFSDESLLLLEGSLPEECVNLVSDDSVNYKFKFKIVDFVNSLLK